MKLDNVTFAARMLRLPLMTFYVFMAALVLKPSLALWIFAVCGPAILAANLLDCPKCGLGYYRYPDHPPSSFRGIDFTFSPHANCRGCGHEFS